jgi:agmatinase
LPQVIEEPAARFLLPAAELSPRILDEYERPVAELIRPASELDEALLSVVGIPFDAAILGRRGAKDGPAAVRSALNGFLCYEPNLDIDLSTAKKVADFGDIDVLHTRIEETWDRVSEVVAALIRLPQPLLVIGGDHGLTFPVLRAITRTLAGPIGVISVDAHFDVRISHHGELSSGVPFRHMLEELADYIAGENFVEFGIGGWLNTKFYADYLRERGARIVTQREIRRGDLDSLIDEALERAGDGTDGIWLSFDIDSVDGSVAAATNVPAIGGLAPHEALEIVWRFARHPKALGMDLMEVSPVLEHSGLTERMAAALILNFAGGRHAIETESATTSLRPASRVVEAT